MNNRIHELTNLTTKNNKKNLFNKSSWGEFVKTNKDNFCNKSIILERYKKIDDYKEFCESVAEGVIRKRLNNEINLDENILEDM